MKNFQKNLKNRISSPYFSILFIIFTLTIFFLILGNFKKYSSEISIIVIPKSESLAVQSENLIQNFEVLPRTLSFYNRMLKDNAEIEDQFAGKNDSERKKGWNDSLRIVREKDSQIIRITVTSRNNDAGKIARKLASTLFSVSSQYYNLKTDLDLRIVDGPINSSRINFLFFPIIISSILGFILAYLINYIFSEFEKLFNKSKEYNLLKNIGDKFKFEKNSKLRLEDFGIINFEKKELEREDKAKEANKEKTEEKKKVEEKTYVKQSSAPANLPIANKPDIKPHVFGPEKIEAKKEEIPAEKGEPTEEEIKKRLNKLLKGEL